MAVIDKSTTFWGYRRENKRAGVRNHVIILPLDDLSNAAAEAERQRAAAAEKQVQTLSQRTDATEQKQQAADKQLAKTRLTDGFEFNAYARSGMLVNSHGKGARGGPGISPASSLNGDAHVGRLGNEKDNYVELSFGKKMTFSDGSWAHFKTMLADGATRELFLNRTLLAEAHLEQPFAMQACPICSKKE